MAIELPLFFLPGLVAGEDFSATASSPLTGYKSTGQYLFVKQNNNRDALTVVHCNSVKDRPLGIAQTNPQNAQAISVMQAGISKVVAGATLTPGDEVGTDSAGRAVKKNPTSTGANYGDYVMGQVLEGAAVGELATVLIGMPYRI